MPRPTLRWFAVLAFCLILVASGPLAGKPRTAPNSRATVNLESASAPSWPTLWNLVLAIWSQGDDKNPSWTKGGCSADPFGRCLPEQSTTGGNLELEGGCSADPNGACR